MSALLLFFEWIRVSRADSFPSGHALNTLCLFGILAGLFSARIRSRMVRICIWSAAALIVLLIGFSRIYLGVHYPSDVIAGYCEVSFWIGALVFADRVRRPASRT